MCIRWLQHVRQRGSTVPTNLSIASSSISRSPARARTKPRDQELARMTALGREPTLASGSFRPIAAVRSIIKSNWRVGVAGVDRPAAAGWDQPLLVPTRNEAGLGGGEVLPQERDDDLGGGRPLLGFDAGLLNDLAPKGDLLPDLIEELLRRAARGCGSVIAQVLDCVFAHQQSAHVRV